MKFTPLGAVQQGKVSVTIATPDPGGRGSARVELDVYGTRYPYKLTPLEARTLAGLLDDAAKALGG